MSDEQCGIRQRITNRALQEITPGMYVNLGIGLPTTLAGIIPPHLNVKL